MLYVTKVMSICHPFEERFVCHPPSESDDVDDEEDSEVIVKLKNPDGYPIILISKKEDKEEVRLEAVHV